MADILRNAWEKTHSVLHDAMPPAVEKQLVKFEKWTGISHQLAEALLLGLIILVVAVPIAMLLFSSSAPFIAFLMCAIYPSYSMLQALYARSEMGEWVTYWLIFASYSGFDNYVWAGQTMGGSLYWLVKVAVLAFCFLPQTRGALLLYRASPFAQAGRAAHSDY